MANANLFRYTYYDVLPLDGLLKSFSANEYYCDLAPPITTMPLSLFNATFRNLERIWGDLMQDNDLPGLAVGMVFDQTVLYKSKLSLTITFHRPFFY